MTVPKFSPNKKLNHVLTGIYKDLVRYVGYDAIKKHMKSYPREPDYNIFQSGRYVPDESVYMIYKKAGYKSIDRMSEEKLEEAYMRQIGHIARYIVYNKVYN